MVERSGTSPIHDPEDPRDFYNQADRGYEELRQIEVDDRAELEHQLYLLQEQFKDYKDQPHIADNVKVALLCDIQSLQKALVKGELFWAALQNNLVLMNNRLPGDKLGVVQAMWHAVQKHNFNDEPSVIVLTLLVALLEYRYPKHAHMAFAEMKRLWGHPETWTLWGADKI